MPHAFGQIAELDDRSKAAEGIVNKVHFAGGDRVWQDSKFGHLNIYYGDIGTAVLRDDENSFLPSYHHYSLYHHYH